MAAHGSEVAASLTSLGGSCELVTTMLPDEATVHDVVAGGGDDLLSGASDDLMVVDMSSCDLRARARSAGCSGHGRASARCSRLGRRAAGVDRGAGHPRRGEVDDVARAQPVLAHLGREIFHVGPLGAGHAINALNNLLSAAGLLATAEVLAVGARFGLDPAVMLEVLNASTGRNNSTERKFGPYVLSGTYDSGFALAHMVKDLGIALNVAHATGTPSPLSEEVVARCREALQALEPGADHTAVAHWVQDLTGTRYDEGPRGDMSSSRRPTSR